MSTPAHKTLLLAGLIAASAILGAPAGRADEPSPPQAASVPAREGKVEANGMTIAYESFGPADRETILLISGYGAQMTMWPDELSRNSCGAGIVCSASTIAMPGASSHLDRLGRPDWAALVTAQKAGKPLPLAYTLKDMADDAVGLLDALGIKKAHIVGASMGAYVAQRVAIHHPGRTLSLTLIGSGTGNPAMPGMTAKVRASLRHRPRGATSRPSSSANCSSRRPSAAPPTRPTRKPCASGSG